MQGEQSRSEANRSRRVRRRIAWAWFAVLLALPISCSSSSKEKTRAAQLSQRCAINSDCENPLVCAFSRCHEECASNRDCIGQANCVVSDDGEFRVCQLDSEVHCNRDGDCNGEQTCAADGECRDGCSKDSDCAEKQVCVEGDEVCADENEVDGSGSLIIDRGNTKWVVSECAEGESCGEAGASGNDGGSGGTSANSGTATGASGGSAGSGSGGTNSGGTNSSGGTSGAGTGGGGSGGSAGAGSIPDDEPCDSNVQCQSGVCDVVCQPPTCSDGTKNGNEKDVDCGGDCLARCDKGAKCDNDQDCQTGNCVEGLCAPVTCPGEPGVAEMVALPAGFCIDSTEVTREQYSAWLARNPSLTGQRAECEENTEFAPVASCQIACEDDCSDYPQTCIDWCDAVAYCEGVGKRLCGNTNPSVQEYALDSLQSQWYYACSSAGAKLYPYGNSADAEACANSTGQVQPVATFDGCQSPVAGFEGVFDLSANVREWEDNCTPEGMCRARGGSWSEDVSCISNIATDRLSYNYYTGFRCCSD